MFGPDKRYFEGYPSFCSDVPTLLPAWFNGNDIQLKSIEHVNVGKEMIQPERPLNLNNRNQRETAQPKRHKKVVKARNWPDWNSSGIPKHWEVIKMARKGRRVSTDTLQGTNISPKHGILKMIFLFPRWDMLVSRRVDLSATQTHTD